MKNKIIRIVHVSTASLCKQFCITCGRITDHLVTRIPSKPDSWHCSQCGQQHKYSIGT